MVRTCECCGYAGHTVLGGMCPSCSEKRVQREELECDNIDAAIIAGRGEADMCNYSAYYTVTPKERWSAWCAAVDCELEALQSFTAALMGGGQ